MAKFLILLCTKLQSLIVVPCTYRKKLKNKFLLGFSGVDKSIVAYFKILYQHKNIYKACKSIEKKAHLRLDVTSHIYNILKEGNEFIK